MDIADLFKVHRDGYLKASHLVQILEPLVVEISEQMRDQRKLTERQGAAIDSLKRDIETERRLRRAMGK